MVKHGQVLILLALITSCRNDPQAPAPSTNAQVDRGTIAVRPSPAVVQRCESGDSASCADAARVLMNPHHASYDPGRAFTLLEGACGDAPDACMLLGKLHVAVSRDLDKAATYFGLACTGGVAKGCARAKELDGK